MQNPIMKRLAAIALTLLVGLPLLAQQKVTVTGTVTDEAGMPVIGAGVVQKGTTNGAVTDFDGKYTISLPEGAVIEYECIGFKTVELPAHEGVMDVKMEQDTQSIEETVVVGYGVQKKSDLTGSITQVKSEDMENRTITSAAQALQGKTSGVQVLSSSAAPGANPTVRIRGISSNGSSDPLYVVDGRISSSGIAGIDPNDIESMEVLKDGASAAIYGARAGNGVILVTTKRGKGEGKISYSYQLTAQSLARIPKVMNSEEYIQYYLEDGRFDLQKFYDNWDFKTNTDWIDYSYETSFMQHHNLTFQAGSDKGSLYVSGSYLYNDGMFAGDADVFKRYTGMVNGTWNIKPWLDITTNNQVAVTNMRQVSEGSDYGSAIMSALQLDPLTPTTYTADNLPDFMRAYLAAGKTLLTDENGNYYGASVYNVSENVNPRIMRDRSYSETNGFNLNGSTALNFKPIKGLVITSRLGYRLYNSDTYGYSNDYYINSNAYANYMSLNGTVSDSIYYQWENFLNYNKSFGKNNISAMLGTSYAQTRTYYVTGSMSGSDGDLGVTQDDPLFYYFAYATATASKSLSGGEPLFNRNLSYFGRLAWNYGSRYYLQASMRADAADLSILPQAERWGYFPSVSAGWTISEEPFFEKAKDVVPFLKFRASWGQNGSTASLGSYAYANVISSTGVYPTSVTEPIYVTAYAPSSSGNESLKWETSEQTNVGFDSRFLRDRLSFSVDWFRKETKDLIVSGITPSTVVGVTASPVNAGNVVNKGWEFELKWRDQIGDFNYGISGNLSTLKNEVTYIHESLEAINGVGVRNYGTITRFEKGYPAWHFYGYHFTGIDPETGDATFEDADGNGELGQNDKMDLGSGIPKMTYGLTINLGWKGLDFLVFGTGSYGAKIFNCLNVVDYASNKLTWFTEDRWTPTNTDGTKPAANASNWTQYLTSDAVVFDGSYFKIKQIQLGYTIPSKITKAIKIDNLRIYGSLDDFFTFTNYIGFDPEVTGVGSSLGVDKGSYPTSKKVVFGVNVTF